MGLSQRLGFMVAAALSLAGCSATRDQLRITSKCDTSHVRAANPNGSVLISARPVQEVAPPVVPEVAPNPMIFDSRPQRAAPVPPRPSEVVTALPAPPTQHVPAPNSVKPPKTSLGNPLHREGMC